MTELYTKWVAAWGNAISIRVRRPENYSRNLTLRYPLTMLLDGEAVRITLDNFCGTESVTLTHASVARSLEGSGIDGETVLPLTFGGAAHVTIPAGERVQSDPAAFPVKRGEKIAISLNFADFTELRSAVNITGPLSSGYFAVGDFADSAVLPMDVSNKTNWFYFLSDVDVLTSADKHCVICYGDSITAQ
ncbi:MAG: lipase, partial [Oscillospiraceae bacterium]|nr:lipase [Oscillospiraceae bacterium]